MLEMLQLNSRRNGDSAYHTIIVMILLLQSQQKAINGLGNEKTKSREHVYQQGDKLKRN